MNLKLLLLVNFVQRLEFRIKSIVNPSKISSMSNTISLLPERYEVVCIPRDLLNNNFWELIWIIYKMKNFLYYKLKKLLTFLLL